MKNIILCLCCALVFVSIGAQTESQRKKIIANYDLVKSGAMIKTFEKENLERKKRVNIYLATLSEKDLAEMDISSLDDVSKDGRPIFIVPSNNTAAITIRAEQLYAGGGLGLNLAGNGIVAGLWEAFEDGNPYPLFTHADLVGRMTKLDFGTGGDSFHSTHVGGTMISSGASLAGNVGRGIAYEASLVAGDLDNRYAEQTQQAAAGLLLSNHSYAVGAGQLPLWQFGAYSQISQTIDQIIAAHPYYLPVFSAGNDRDDADIYNPGKNGYDLLKNEAAAKNTITSAAVLPVADYSSPFSVTMSSFSNYGPTDDGRIKPDISSQGVNVISTSNDSSNTGYASLQGTSMSAPGITGLLILLQEHYNDVNGNFMLAATAKGVLLHTADEAGFTQGPDYRFGWGLANGSKAAQTITNSSIGNSFVEETSLDNTNSRTFNVKASGGEPLMVSISWTDPAGALASQIVDDRTPALVNDLDLKLSKGATEYFPWKFDPENQVIGVSRNSTNDVDNFEKVEVDGPNADDVFEVVINHKGGLSGGSQNYSLVITGGTLENLSTQDNTLSNSLRLFPNPSKGQLTISFDSGYNSADDVKIDIVDLSGRQVFNTVFEGASQRFKETIDLNRIQSGVYIANISQGNSSTSHKIIIE
jgi:serine protease AprX